MIRSAYFLIAFVLIVFGQVLPATAQSADPQVQYFSAIPDLPLMNGLVELDDEVMSFDKPEGRIVEVYVLMDGVSREDIMVYYRGTLPQLGWSPDGDSRFFRKGEYLELEFEDGADGEVLKVMVRPAL